VLPHDERRRLELIPRNHESGFLAQHLYEPFGRINALFRLEAVDAGQTCFVDLFAAENLSSEPAEHVLLGLLHEEHIIAAEVLAVDPLITLRAGYPRSLQCASWSRTASTMSNATCAAGVHIIQQ
jgi:hypothetical protein